jgi:hypothetical protein
VYNNGTNATQANPSSPILGKAPVSSKPLKAAVDMFFIPVFKSLGFTVQGQLDALCLNLDHLEKSQFFRFNVILKKPGIQ